MGIEEQPIHVRISNAKHELKYLANQICIKYDLPGAVFDLIIESILNDERAETITLISAQFENCLTVDNKKEDIDGNSK